MKIKTITGYSANLDMNGIEQNEYKSSFREYDFNQNLIKDYGFSDDGEIEFSTDFVYNGRNQKMEQITGSSEDTVGERLEFRYNEEGELAQLDTIYLDQSKSVEIYTRYGLNLSISLYDENNIVYQAVTKRFDELGNLLEEITHDELNKTTSRTVYLYNEKHLLFRSSEYNQLGEMLKEEDYDYDMKGNLIKQETYDHRGKLLSSLEYRYNQNNDLIWQRIDDTYLYEVEYDDQNRKIREQRTNTDNDVIEEYKLFGYNNRNLVSEEVSSNIGQKSFMGVFSYPTSDKIKTRFMYEFYEVSGEEE